MTTDLPLIIEPAELAARLPRADLLPIGVYAAQAFNEQHIPGSALIEPRQLVCGIPPATGKLPEPEQLSEVFSSVGLTPDRHVVAYDDEGGGWAGRLIWTLDVLGHQRYSLLDGGLVAWLQAGLPVESGPAAVAPGDYQASIDRSASAGLDEVMAAIDDPETVIWDARAREEYEGTKITAARNGHIPGAINLDWLELMDRERGLRLKPLPQLQAMLSALGIVPGKRVITHCQTHHRSGLTYLVGKALGLDIRAYDGSWSEWGNHPDTPVET